MALMLRPSGQRWQNGAVQSGPNTISPPGVSVSQRSDWLLVLLALLLGAILVLGAVAAYYVTGSRYVTKAALGWDGSALELLVGDGLVRGDSLELTALDERSQGVVRIPAPKLDTTRWVTFAVDISDLAARETRVGLAWHDETARAGERLIWLAPMTSGTLQVDLAERPEWQGNIGALFLVVAGALPQPLTIHRIEIRPPIPVASAILRQVWNEWTTFEGWRGHSINFIVGGTRDGLFPPVLAAALWVVFSAALYSIMRLFGGGTWRAVPFAVILLAGWLMLDARWQFDLLRQLQITGEQYAGKSYEEKRMAAEDRGLFLFAEEVKRRIAPAPARIFLIAAAPNKAPDYYIRTRLSYFLQPHNVGSLWSGLPVEGIGPGDYVIILHPHQWIREDIASGELRWREERVLRVERLMSSSIGNLYRAR